MNIVSKLHFRIQKYKQTYDQPPKILLLTKEELTELNDIPRDYSLFQTLADLGMRAELVYPEQISYLLEVLSQEQLTILLTHPDKLTRELAQQEIKNRQQAKS